MAIEEMWVKQLDNYGLMEAVRKIHEGNYTRVDQDSTCLLCNESFAFHPEVVPTYHVLCNGDIIKLDLR